MDPVLAMVSVGAPVVLGGASTAAWLALYPPLPKDLGGAADLDDLAERVRIPLTNGDAIEAWHLEGSRPASVLLLHGYGRTHHRMWRYAGFLRQAGFGTLAIDFRSSRRSGRLPTTLGHHELVDALGAWSWLRQRAPTHRTAVMGESLGGAVALLLAAERHDVAAVVVDCPFASGGDAVEDMLGRFVRLPVWPFAPLARRVGKWASGCDPYHADVVGAAARLDSRPALFIHSERDERLSPRQSERLWEAAGRHSTLWRVPGAGHNRAWIENREEYESRVSRFLEGSLDPRD